MKWFMICLAFVLLASCKKKSISDQNNAILPTIVADSPLNAGLYNVDLSATISSVEDVTILEAGFVLDTLNPPSLDRNFRKVVLPLDPAGNISSGLTRLLPGFRYFVRAYAKTSDGVAYSDMVWFTTMDEEIFEGDVLLTSQQEVISFAAKHYNRIAGELVITGDVTDLTPLADLGTVDRKLSVAYTSQLVSLNGLQTLWRINTVKDAICIDIRDNQMLQNLQGLQSIVSSTGEINIYRNNALVTLAGLDSLKYLEYGRLKIDNCGKLTDLHGLESLEVVEQEIALIDNEKLADVSSLRSLQETDRLIVKGNPNLSNLNGFQALDTLISLELFYNTTLSDITALANLESVYILQIDNNKLTTLTGLHNITTLGNLQIENSVLLTDISALSQVDSIENIRLVGTGLADLNGLSTLTYGTKIELYQNNALQSMNGLNNLRSIVTLRVAGNANLTNLQAIGNLEQLSEAHFQDNWTLTDFCPLKNTFTNVPGIIFNAVSNGANPTREQVIANCP